jgi:hypothetical protein
MAQAKKTRVTFAMRNGCLVAGIVEFATGVLTKGIIIVFGERGRRSQDERLTTTSCLGSIHVSRTLIAFGFASD